MDNLKRALQPGKRHAVFDCHLAIHDVVNVPFVSGSFRCKWKFHHSISAHTAAHTIASVAKIGHSSVNGSGSKSETPSGSEASSLASSDSHPDLIHHPIQALNQFAHQARRSSLGHHDRPLSESSTNEDSVPGSIKQSFDSPLDRTPSNSRESTASPSRRPTIRASSSTRTTTPTLHREATITRSATPEPSGSTDPRHLRDYTVHFHQPVFCPVSIPISKNGVLEPSYVKLSIKQTVHTLSEKKQEHKLGHVQLNLAEYAPPGLVKDGKKGKGKEKEEKKPKRFLLRDGKTNALLRMGVELVWIGGDKDYLL